MGLPLRDADPAGRRAAVNFRELGLRGAFLIEAQPIADERGAFLRAFCRRELADRGIEFDVVQANISSNRLRGTVRGMHLQREPFAEPKLVRCVRGAVHDVIIDLRPGSPTFRQQESVELTAGNAAMLYVPKGFAHGFQTLEDASDLLYLMGQSYSAEHAGGVRWNDPAFRVRWPLPISSISAKDLAFPDYHP
jgi:dTDP-4-dehydrorhamnose 3,5-epimerase